MNENTEKKLVSIHLSKPDIVFILYQEGIEPRQKGRYLWALCPLPGHIERTPSFKVDPERQSFYCFGCHNSGDSIALVMKLHGLIFKEALNYLGLSDNTPTFNRTQIQRAAEDKALVSAFNGDCKRITNNLYDLLRRIDRLKMKARNMADVEKLAFWYRKEPIWEYWLSILEGNDEKAKYEIWQEVRNGAV